MKNGSRASATGARQQSSTFPTRLRNEAASTDSVAHGFAGEYTDAETGLPDFRSVP